MSNPWRSLVALLIGLCSMPTVAMSLDELRSAGRLKAQVVVETSPPLYQRAPVIIAIEVATPRWFSRGTQVQAFRIPGAVVRPVSTFADNQSRRLDGETWSVQRWRYRVYGSDAGRLQIPPLEVSVSVNTEDHGVVAGELTVGAPEIVLERPPGTESLDDWVAATALRVEQNWEGRLDAYETGDALTLVRRFRIEDAPAMVLTGSPLPELDGIAIYTAPPVLDDLSNRGRLTGLREERIVFTFEQSGDYTIPGLTLYWFNTATAQLEEITLDGLDVTVNSGIKELADETGAEGTSLLPWLVAMGGLAMIALLVPRIVGTPLIQGLARRLKGRQSATRAQRSYRRAVRAKDSERCVALLYGRLAPEEQHPLSSVIGGSTLTQLMAHAYGDAPTPPTPDALMELWRKVGAHERAGKAPSRLTLNPLPSGQSNTG